MSKKGAVRASGLLSLIERVTNAHSIEPWMGAHWLPSNINADIAQDLACSPNEQVDTLLATPGVRIERIIPSRSHLT